MWPLRHFLASAFLAGFGAFSFNLLIPILVVDRAGYSLAQLGLVLAAYSVSVILFSPLWGTLSDRTKRRRPFIVLGYGIFSLASLLFLFADTLWAFALLRFVQGIGFSAHPMLTAMFSDHLGERAARRFGVYSSAEALGWGLGGVTAGLLAEQLGVKAAFAAAAVFPLVSAAIVFARLPRAVTFSAAEQAETDRVPPRLYFLYATLFVRMAAAIALWAVMPLYLQSFVGSLTLVGVVSGINMLTQPVFMLAVGRLAETVSRLKLVLWGIGGSVVTFWVYAGANDVWQMVLGQVMIAGSWALLYIGANTYIMDHTSRRSRGKGFGLLQGSISAAMAVGPLLGGILSELLGIRGMIWAVSLVMLLSLPFLLRLRWLERGPGRLA